MATPPHGRNTLFLSLVESLWGVGLSVISAGAVLPVFLLSAGADHRVIALLPSLGALGAGMTFWLSGWVVRGGGGLRRWVVGLHALAPTPLALVGLWLLFGPGWNAAAVLIGWGLFYAILGILYPLWMDYMARILAPDKRGRAFGAIFFVQTLAGVGGAAAAAEVLRKSTSDAAYALLFFVAWAAMAGGSLFFWGTTEEVQTPSARRASGLGAHFKAFWGLRREIPWLRSYIAARWFTRGTFPLVVNFFAARAVTEAGATASDAALLGGVALGGQAVAGVLAGTIGDRYGHRSAAILGQIALVLAALLLLLPLTFGAYLAVAALAGAFLATEYTSQGNWLMELAGPQRRQAAIALTGFLLTPVAVAVPLLGGWLMDSAGFRPVSAGVAALLFVAIVVEWLFVPNPKPGASSRA